jgi:Rad3-related DNA helicase
MGSDATKFVNTICVNIGGMEIYMVVSVRNLIEFVLRSGDIDSGFTSSSNATDGIRLHKKLQKAEGDGYSAEVPLSIDITCPDGIVTLEGRADGIILRDNKVTIDEIKSTATPLDIIDINYDPLHIAQAKCYAFIYATQNSLNSIDIRLSYCNIEDESVKYIVNTFTLNELAIFIHEILDDYTKWAVKVQKEIDKRQNSIINLPFPYHSYRSGQRKLAGGVYKIVKDGKRLFAQAPTGTGKTISTLYPALKAMGEGACTKIFYLTAKTIGRKTALAAAILMQEKGLIMKTIILTAKAKICFLEKPQCNPRDCEYAKGHYDRVKECINDLFENESIYSRVVIEEYALKHKVCPFELSLDMSLWCDTIICDYNYLFDPRASLKRFFSEEHTDFAFLIDEAHNLPDRAREMFSAKLLKSSFLKQKKKFKGRLGKYLTKINDFFIEKRKNEAIVEQEMPEELIGNLKGFISQAEKVLSNHSQPPDEELLDLYFQAYSFLKISELYDENYVTYYTVENNDVSVKLFCVNTSFLLNKTLKKGQSAVFFSATLAPIEYFRDICGGELGDYKLCLSSPFPKENLCLLIADNISTKYKDREQSLENVVELIHSVVSNKNGNFFVFFPSYLYMQAVYEAFCNKFQDIETILQSGDMSEEEKENFLDMFKDDFSKCIVGFVVLGGVFSEGIDLVGNRLSGAIIVGVGLPQISLERNIIKDYFNGKNNMGFEFAYTYPGMNKVLQAAGRVIRSETDKGIVLLIDNRFSQKTYKSLFPQEWDHSVKVKSKDDVNKYMLQFWKE